MVKISRQINNKRNYKNIVINVKLQRINTNYITLLLLWNPTQTDIIIQNYSND